MSNLSLLYGLPTFTFVLGVTLVFAYYPWNADIVVVHNYTTIMPTTETVHVINNTKTVTIREVTREFTFVQPSIACQNAKLHQFDHRAITGMSMQPALFADDIALTLDYSDKMTLVPGDIIIFRQGELFAMHRIVAVYDEYVVTRGDNNHANDAHIEYQNIEQVVCGVLF